MAKLRLFVRSRNSHGSYIASVPVERLKVLSQRFVRTWYFEDGWLVLETN